MSTETTSSTQVPFVGRHVGPDYAEIAAMLEVVGQPDLDTLVDTAIPGGIRIDRALRIDAAPSEEAVLAELRGLAARNKVLTSMIGMGYYGTNTPPVVVRRVLQSPTWYTAYTPYQPEISQGRLEALLNYQTMVADLTGLDISNASLLDEATAAAEAMALMRRATKKPASAVLLVDAQIFPQTLGVINTRALPTGIDVVVVPDIDRIDSAEALTAAAAGREVFGVIVQYPGLDGVVRDFETLTRVVHDNGGLVTACADLLALTLLVPPGEWGADVAVGSSQRFGVPMGFGGPHAGFMAVHSDVARSMPGRLVGLSVDAEGAPAYRLALQTREQHIRREKATSNICTAQVLLAVMASMYAVWHGPQGLADIARRVHGWATTLAEGLRAGGLEVSEQFFDTVRVHVPDAADRYVREAANRGINIWQVDDHTVSIACDELTTSDHINSLWTAFGVAGAAAVPAGGELGWPEKMRRTSSYLDAPVFHSYRSETSMLRYMHRLAERDFALDRGMIPLGSCTMKLNATTEMEAITWPEFGQIHPFAPAYQSEGFVELINQLCGWLVEITGYDAVSLQPNAGSQGEFAGLMAITEYHKANGEPNRTVCLIPASAHGTNAASAAMAGMKVVVVKSAPDGTIDMADLQAKIDQYAADLAGIMVTYPSTHGVYEDTITQLCALVHDAGGQVYVDGANLNALVGLARPGKFGADVSHLNLHKTFAIPHGGGGPGVGPVAVRAHLAPYLPSHPVVPIGPDTSYGPVSAAPYGSAGVLPISWAYIRLMGGAGLAHATKVAVLNANYIATRLGQHYPVLYSGTAGLVAHECILDLRQITKETGVTVDDVAKRLIDYGFHAPTMSFPVAGTLMIEPTESEDLGEIDRFIDAMIAIRDEIEAVHKGEVEVASSALRNAPHTAESLTGEWDHPYDRATAVYPGKVDPLAKYWPPVRRIDGPYGDRNLICSCPRPEAFED